MDGKCEMSMKLVVCVLVIEMLVWIGRSHEGKGKVLLGKIVIQCVSMCVIS